MKKPSRTKYRQEFNGDHHFDYKDPASLMRFVTDAGRVTPSRLSKLSVAQQRKVANAIKKARNLGLLPTGTEPYDSFGRPESISPQPFEI